MGRYNKRLYFLYYQYTFGACESRSDEVYSMVSSTYANILKYHIQGMPKNVKNIFFINV